MNHARTRRTGLFFIACLRGGMVLCVPGIIRNTALAFSAATTNNGESSVVPALLFQQEHMTFESACQKAVETQVTLILTEDVTLSETIQLKNHQRLHIQGHYKHDVNLPTRRRVKIKGDVHSLFLLNSKSQLILEHVDLDHSLETDNHREVGAAIHLRYKASASITDATVTSASGFCLWAVQKTRVALQGCHLVAPTRSAMVCFGQAQCQLHDCGIDRAGVHGVCARGAACHIDLVSCGITASAARAIYAYANASIAMTGCHISGTMHPEKAAIEISSQGCRGGSATATATATVCEALLSSSLMMKDCEVVDNRGVGIRLRVAVSCRLQGDNLLERNAHGDWDIIEHLTDDDDNPEGLSNKTNGGLPPLRRDTAGSSFRRGDWLCTNCQKINPAKGSVEEICGLCTSEKSRGGRLLTTEEILQCNQGRDFRIEFPPSKQSSSTTGSTTGRSDTIMIAPTESSKYDVMWQFDGDDEKGWLEYDRESSILLEDAYQRMVQSGVSNDTNCIVALFGGKYRVDLEVMEQINTDSQFLRLVRRRTIMN